MNSRKNAEDPFSFLTSPLPPPTSKDRDSIFQPMKASEPMIFSSRTTSKAPHNRESSADSDFGSFVSGSATAIASHPLSGSTPSSPSRNSSSANVAAREPLSMDRVTTSSFIDALSSARERAEQNQQRVLDEHNVDEDDPLGWLGNPTSSKGSSNSETPKEGDHETKYEGLSRVDEESLVEALEEQSLIDLSTPSASTANATLVYPDLQQPSIQPHSQSLFSPVTTAPSPIPPPHLPRTSSENSLHLADNRSQSRSPPRPHMNRSPTATSTLSRSWMSSLLSTSRASPARTSSPSASGSAVPLSRSPSIESGSESVRTGSRSVGGHESGSEQGVPMSPTEESLHTLFARAQHASTLPLPSLTSLPSLASLHSPFATIRNRVGSGAHSRAATEPASIASSTTSPFAPHTYTPPSGAPGFAGDHNWNSGGFEYDAHVEKKNVKLVGRKEGTEAVLDTKLAGLLRPYLPALARLPSTWTLLYSLDQHGISLNTLYSRCDVPLPSVGGKIPPGTHGQLLAVQDVEGGVFGAWISEGIHLSHGAYYGGGDSFLWRFTSNGELDLYKWTGRNNYVALCSPQYVSFGGGDGHYGLYIASSLISGTTAPCPTFSNTVLCTHDEHHSRGPGGMESFECVGLEVWGVGP